MPNFLQGFDWLLFTSMMLLIALGVLMILSTALGESNNYDLATKQVIFAGIGLVGFVTLWRSNYRMWQPLSWALYLGSVALLFGVFIYGTGSHGSVRWIDLGAFRLQPSELVKITAILLLANIFSHLDMTKIRNILFSLILVIIPAGLIFVQPDLGSALVLMAIWLGMILATEAPKRYFVFGLALLGILLPLGLHFLQTYQRNRLLSFIDPAADPLGAGYNVIQSTVAVGSGGWTGLGFGRGTQSHLNFLPEHHTDFIFATMAEELGLVGSIFLLILLGLLIWRLLAHISGGSGFGALTLIGLAVLVAFQAAINISMNIGLAPVTGITLPFVSYGGSSLITLMAGMGLAMSVIRHRTIHLLIDED